MLAELDALVRERFSAPEGSAVIVNERQRRAVAETEHSLRAALASIDEGMDEQLILVDLYRAAKAAGVELIEQPLPAGDDALLEHIDRIVPLCADESAHDRASLATIAKRYDAVNIKLDKTGGLTEALATAAEARKLRLKIMVGCMVATSLAMAPALLLAQDADFVDLDGPLLLERDRVPGLAYSSGMVMPAPAALWG
jgi:L-alanine-DL-glutamate epimerase-like enolase superfamily enzyme